MLTRLRPGRRAYINTLVFLALIAIWWIITATSIVKPLFLPSPGSVVSAFWDANTCRPINDSGTAEVCGGSTCWPAWNASPSVWASASSSVWHSASSWGR